MLWFKVFLSNTNNLPTIVWFHVFLSNTNNLYTVVWFQVFLFNIDNLLYGSGSPYRLMAKVLDFGTFGLIPIGKA